MNGMESVEPRSVGRTPVLGWWGPGPPPPREGEGTAGKGGNTDGSSPLFLRHLLIQHGPGPLYMRKLKPPSLAPRGYILQSPGPGLGQKINSRFSELVGRRTQQEGEQNEPEHLGATTPQSA